MSRKPKCRPKALMAGLFLMLLPACGGRAERYPGVMRKPTAFGYHYTLDPPPPAPAGNPILLVHGGGLLLGSATDRRFDELSRNLALHGLEVLSARLSPGL
jgi:hypothetical protein